MGEHFRVRDPAVCHHRTQGHEARQLDQLADATSLDPSAGLCVHRTSCHSKCQSDLGVVHQPVDHGDDTGGVGEDLAPVGEGAIGGDDGAFLLVAAADQFEHQVGVAIGVGQIADFVDEQ